MIITIPTTEQLMNFADTPPPMNYIYGVKQINQEVENTMFDECIAEAPRKIKFAAKTVQAPMANAQVIGSVPVEATQRDYAIALIKQIGEQHAKALRVQFNMDPKNPGTFLELEALIKAGDYTVTDDAKKEDARYYNVFYGVTFGKPADKDGYEAARAVLKAAAQKALTKVTLKPIEELEAVIEDFEGWTLPTAD